MQHKVDIACLTETWLNDDIPDEIVNQNGYITARNDRKGKWGGGVCVLIRDDIPHYMWSELVDDEFETLWVTLRPPKIPRKYSHITIGVIYHPPKANNWRMTQHINKCVDTIIQKHPSTGIFITGDLKHFKENTIRSSYDLKQTVTKIFTCSQIHESRT